MERTGFWFQAEKKERRETFTFEKKGQIHFQFTEKFPRVIQLQSDFIHEGIRREIYGMRERESVGESIALLHTHNTHRHNNFRWSKNIFTTSCVQLICWTEKSSECVSSLRMLKSFYCQTRLLITCSNWTNSTHTFIATQKHLSADSPLVDWWISLLATCRWATRSDIPSVACPPQIEHIHACRRDACCTWRT